MAQMGLMQGSTSALAGAAGYRYHLDPDWWRSESIQGEPMLAVLARRDVTAIFTFLRSRGWSVSALSSATEIPENRIRRISAGHQIVTTYDVLARVADGLLIERGLMGLAYINDGQASITQR